MTDWEIFFLGVAVGMLVMGILNWLYNKASMKDAEDKYKKDE
jgi:hypothetical protein